MKGLAAWLARLLPGAVLATYVACGAPLKPAAESGTDAGAATGSLLDGGAGLAKDAPADSVASGSSSSMTDAASATNTATEGGSDASATETVADAGAMDASTGAALEPIELDAGWDGSLAALLPYCSGAPDVFNVTLTTLGSVPYSMTEQATGSTQVWSSSVVPPSPTLAFSISVSAGSAGNVTLSTALGFPIGIATYDEPVNHTVPRPYLDLTVGDLGLTASGNTSGTFDVLDLETTDAGGGTLISLLVTFDISIPSFRAVGCMRYGGGGADSSGAFDASAE